MIILIDEKLETVVAGRYWPTTKISVRAPAVGVQSGYHNKQIVQSVAIVNGGGISVSAFIG